MSECVKVIVRCRPMNKKEKDLNCLKIVQIDQRALQCTLTKPRILGSEIAAGQEKSSKPQSEAADYEPKSFTFDGVYDDDSKQRDVYEDTAYPLVNSVLEGYNGTIFAYGQTGCGKSFTMSGVHDVPELRGIIPNTFDQIFGAIAASSDPNKQHLVRALYVEIYNEEVRDLLSDNPKAKCDLKEDKDRGVYIKGVTNNEVTSVEHLNALMEKGNSNRSVGATLMNADSSRSHSIFTITVECSEPDEVKGGGEMKIKQGKLNLVDLAGSERQSKTKAEGERLKEATKINLSLSALGNVIEALVKVSNGDKSRHIPYRDSKLTRLLQDSLGGNTKTVMIAALSPADYNYDETLSTLRYANRAKNIKNKPKINEDPKDALLREYQDEIRQLKQMLEERGLGDLIAQISKGGAGGAGGAGGGAAKPKLALPPSAAAPLALPPAASNEAGASADYEGAAGSSAASSSARGNAGGNSSARKPSSRAVGATSPRSPAKSPRNADSSSSSDASAAATTSAPFEVPQTMLAISDADKQRLQEDQAELQEDVARLDEERSRHENMANMLSEQLRQESEQRMQFEREKAELESKIEQMKSQGQLVAQEELQREKKQLEEVQRQREAEWATVQAALQQEKAEHEQRARELQAEMQEKLMEEERKRKEIEDKYISIQAQTSKEKELLQNKLKALQEKLLSGHQQIRSLKEEQEEKARQLKLQEQENRRKQAELEDARRQQEENALMIEEKYGDIKHEVEDKTNKLRRLAQKYRTLKAEKEEDQNAWENEKEGYLNNIRDIYRECRLYRMICESFLTRNDMDKIVRNAVFIESQDTWKLPKVDLPVAFPSLRVVPNPAASQLSTYSGANYSSSGGSGGSNAMLGAGMYGNNNPVGPPPPGSPASAIAKYGVNSVERAIASGQYGQQPARTASPLGKYSSNASARAIPLTASAAAASASASASTSAPPVRMDANGADASWKRSVLSQAHEEANEIPARSSTPNRGAAVSPVPGRGAKVTNVIDPTLKAREMSEQIVDMTNNIRRRAAFEPGADGGGGGAMSATEEKQSPDDGLPKRPAFQPAANGGSSSPLPASPRTVLAAAANVPKRPAFQPAATGGGGAAQNKLPESAMAVPARPAFAPNGVLPPSSPSNTAIDELLQNAPKARPAFQPASIPK